MTDSTPKQLSFFDDHSSASTDDRPLPLIVADRWDFPLQCHEVDGTTYFSILDWVAGIGSSDVYTVEQNISRITNRVKILKKSMQYVMFGRGKTQSLFTTDSGLYRIAEDMRVTKNRPALKAIKDYIAAAAAKIDDQRRNPEQAIEQLESYASRKRQFQLNKLERAGYSDHPSVQQLQDRHDNIRVFRQLKSTIAQVCDNPQWATLINAEYMELFGEVNSQLQIILNTKSVRDGLPSMQLLMLTASERMLQTFLQRCDAMSNEQVINTIERIVRPMGDHLRAVCDEMGVHHITGEWLLPERIDA